MGIHGSHENTFDKAFTTENLPLYASEAEVRERILSNVSYELLMNLLGYATHKYSGRVKVSFMISEKATQEELS